MIHRLAAPAAFVVAILAAPAFAEGDFGRLEKSASTPVAETVDAFKAVLEKKGATVFATVDHAKGAQNVDMEIPPATVIIFGNPKLGTPLMQLAPSIGLDLPLKALFADDGYGKTRIIYPDIAAVAESHGIDPGEAAVQNVAKALDGLTGAVADKK